MENVKKCIFLLLCSLISKYIKIQSLRNSRGQGHFLILAKGHMSVVCQRFQRTASLKQQGQFHLNFICGLQAKGERKFVYLDQVT